MKKLNVSSLLLIVCLVLPVSVRPPPANAAPPPMAPLPAELSTCTDACQDDYWDCRSSCRYLPADERFYCLDACDNERFDCLASCN